MPLRQGGEELVKLCLTIGVSRARPLSSLLGTVTAAQEIGEWAEAAGYVTTVITDKASPVTISRLRAALLEMLPENEVVEAFILHFAGHGLREGAEQNLWFPSDWHKEMRVISVEGLKRQLFRHGIKTLTIISDACRSQPTDVEMADLTRDTILPRGPYDFESPVIDRFNAVSDGQKAFMLNGDKSAPARCIFSTVLLEGLSGHRDEAFDKYMKDCVIPESLALFSTLRMKEISELYRLECAPDNHVGIPREHIIYHQRNGGAVIRPTPPRWPAPQKESKDDDRIVLGFQTGYVSGLERWSHRAQSRDKLQTVRRSFHLADGDYWNGAVNLVVLGRMPLRIWSVSRSRAIEAKGAQGTYKVDVPVDRASQVLIEFEDDVVATAVVYDGLVTVLSRDDTGVIGWACASRWDGAQRQIDLSLDVIADLHLGKISADQVDSLAVRLRELKHLNPIFGAVSSYLYDYTGDIDSIRRMAFFYCSYRQDIPFDIAFMGMLPMQRDHVSYGAKVPRVRKRAATPNSEQQPDWVTRATRSASGSVAGLWPWLRQGWEFIEAPEDEEKAAADSLRDIVPFLLPSPFTSFRKKGAEMLIENFQMEANR